MEVFYYGSVIFILITKKIYDSNEITGRIYLQLCNLFLEAILHESKDLFFDHAFSVMHKLNATKYHLDNYYKIEQVQYQKAEYSFKRGKYDIEEQLPLIFELEAFLYQIKSSLDMLVKLLIPITDNIVRTQTYSKKGEGIIPGLEQFKQKKGVRTDAVDGLIQLMRDDKDAWLQTVVEWRDELNHIKALKNYTFEPYQLPDGKVIVKKPSFKDMDTVKFMELTYHNNLEFHQDFMVLALTIKAPSRFVPIKQDEKQAIEEFKELGKFVKWAWGMSDCTINES